jgi:tetratricopeptide (TPR) repeat protein
MKTKIESLIKSEAYEEALEYIESILSKDAENIDILYLKADLCKKTQKTSEAVNIYNHILELKPDEKRAEVERDLVHIVMLQENNDKFESTNLYDDPWL